MGTPAHLNRPPHSVFLSSRGRSMDGWWGCITFRARIEDDGEPDVAAWVPASHLSKPSWSTDGDLPRIDLPADRHLWPAPPKSPSWYAGPRVDGPLPVPYGVELVTGPAWRKNPPCQTTG